MLQGIFALAPFALQVCRAAGSKDVTAEMQAQDAARRESGLRATAELARERVSQLQQVTSGLACATTPQDVARVILEEGVPALGALRCTLHVVIACAPRAPRVGRVCRHRHRAREDDFAGDVVALA